jgi:hypothetical protein
MCSVLPAPNPRVQRTRAYASLRRSPLTRRPLGGRNGPRLQIVIVGASLVLGCAARERAVVRVTDLEGKAMPGVEVRSGPQTAFSNLDGVATFHELAPGPHTFDAHFKWFRSCGPVTLVIGGASPAVATITMRLVPGQGWVDTEGRAVTPTAEDLAQQSAEESRPCPTPKKP